MTFKSIVYRWSSFDSFCLLFFSIEIWSGFSYCHDVFMIHTLAVVLCCLNATNSIEKNTKRRNKMVMRMTIAMVRGQTKNKRFRKKLGWGEVLMAQVCEIIFRDGIPGVLVNQLYDQISLQCTFWPQQPLTHSVLQKAYEASETPQWMNQEREAY